jgi:single-strand DNA-binding protein
MGHLARDPEMRFTPNGKGVCNFTIATSWGFGDNQTTEWHNCVIWDGNNEKTPRAQWASRLRKGDLVYTEGRIQTRTWKDQDNNERSSKEIVCTQVDWMRSKGMAPGNITPETPADNSMNQFGNLVNVDPDDIPF